MLEKVIRGCGWYHEFFLIRSSYRDNWEKFNESEKIGLRVVWNF